MRTLCQAPTLGGGVDLLRGSLIAGHYDRAGLYGAYGDVHADVNGLVTNPAATAYVLSHTGSMNLNSWSAGGYWTHVGPGGWYLDAVLQGTWYYGSASTQFAKLNTDGTGFIASLEGGYPFSWRQLGPGFVIEPQGQILWSSPMSTMNSRSAQATRSETAYEAHSAPDIRGEAYSLSYFTQAPKVTPIGALLQNRAAGMRA